MAISYEAMARLKSSDLDASLGATIQGYISIASRGEEIRRRDDRIGARLWYGQHWSGVNQPRERAAIVANVARALVHHIVSIMTKQSPTAVVEADDEGDAEAAQRMRVVMLTLFKKRKFLKKLKRALILSKCTRTAAIKVVWDPTLKGGIGDIDFDVIPGWRLILDGRCSSPEMMQFAGDRTVMTRGRAMMFYPDSATAIKEGVASSYRRQATMNAQGSPLRDPWSTSPLPSTGATTINGKPTITSFAGDPGFYTDNDNLVEIAEIYHKDLTLYEVVQIARDDDGNEIQEDVMDENGVPQFEEHGMHHLPDVDGTLVSMPLYRVQKQPVLEKVYKRKYPQYRRTTIMNPDGTILDDCAWDGPLPYGYYNDMESLEGMWYRGSILDLETLQAMTNVLLSNITDASRFGLLQAFFASPTSGLLHKVLYPGPGQVIEGDPTQIEPVPVAKVDEVSVSLIDRMVALMERVVGAQGIMQGNANDAAPRGDSAAAFDSLAEISGSRIVETVQNMESATADVTAIAGWMIQNYYTPEHKFQIEMQGQDPSWQSVWGELVKGSFSYSIEVGSSMAWSEGSRWQRNLVMYQQGLIDRVEFYKRSGMSDWKSMLKRIDDEMQAGMFWRMGTPPPKGQKAQQKQPGKK